MSSPFPDSDLNDLIDEFLTDIEEEILELASDQGCIKKEQIKEYFKQQRRKS